MAMNRETRHAYAQRLVHHVESTKLGMTQEQLAKAAGLSPRAVSSFLRGETVPNETTLDAIAAAIGYAPDPDEVRAAWPTDVSVFLDLLGVWLMARPETERRAVMREIARQVANSA